MKFGEEVPSGTTESTGKAQVIPLHGQDEAFVQEFGFKDPKTALRVLKDLAFITRQLQIAY